MLHRSQITCLFKHTRSRASTTPCAHTQINFVPKRDLTVRELHPVRVYMYMYKYVHIFSHSVYIYSLHLVGFIQHRSCTHCMRRSFCEMYIYVCVCARAATRIYRKISLITRRLTLYRETFWFYCLAGPHQHYFTTCVNFSIIFFLFPFIYFFQHSQFIFLCANSFFFLFNTHVSLSLGEGFFLFWALIRLTMCSSNNTSLCTPTRWIGIYFFFNASNY